MTLSRPAIPFIGAFECTYQPVHDRDVLERGLGLQDAGATVAFLLVDAMRAHVSSGEH